MKNLLFGNSWKTSFAGMLGAMALLVGSHLTDPTSAPPITTGNLATAAIVYAVGRLAKDHDVTGGSRPQ